MPNWCNNTVEISHKDPAMIQRVREGFNKGALLAEFFPTPQELVDTVAGFPGEDLREAHEAQEKSNIEKYGYKNWYDWNVANWGTKWDIGADGQPAIEQDANSLTLNFDSAWAPPCQAYEKLVGLGFTILAYYYEPGMGFAGKWEGNEDDYFDDYYELGGMNSSEIAATLPDDLDECFAISENVAEWEAENEQEDENQ